MLWEVEITPLQHDPEWERVSEEYGLLTHGKTVSPVARTSRGYLLEGELSREQAERLTTELLVDSLVETGRITSLGEPGDHGWFVEALADLHGMAWGELDVLDVNGLPRDVLEGRLGRADVWWVITWSMSWIAMPAASSTSCSSNGVSAIAARWIPLESVNIRAPGSSPFGYARHSRLWSAMVVNPARLMPHVPG